ncbi:hypothetical protein ACLESD_50455, partial [Pyxidicoccus sp. 3LFB2]
RGHLLRVTLDLPPGEPLPGALPMLVLLPGDGSTAPVERPMRWEDEDRLVAEYPLEGSGTWHPVVRLGSRVLRAPPVTLPYAPEFEPGSAKEGLELLRAVAAVGGGVERLSMTGLFMDAPESQGRLPLAPWLVGFALAVLLAEVVVRRFLSGPRVRKAGTVSATKPAFAGAPVSAGSTVPARVTAPVERKGEPERQPEVGDAATATPEGAGEKPKEGSVDSALEAARARARRRLDR